MNNKPSGWLVCAMAMVGVLAVVSCQRPHQDQVSNVVFVLIDTLRADHLGTYGYDRATSPQIDAAASRGVLFENVLSVANWTNPAIMTLFTGMSPGAVMRPALHREAIQLAIPTEVPTLAEILQANGFRTFGLVDHPGINRRLGFARGFDEFNRLYKKGAKGGKSWAHTDADYVYEELDKVLTRVGNDPFYLYLHLVYPHRPYRAPADFQKHFGPAHRKNERVEKQGMINAYDAEILYTDELVGRMIRRLDQLRLSENTHLIITSDHGEGFWEHGFPEHGNTFFNEFVRVPLIIVGPRAPAAKRVSQWVSNLNVFDTVLDLTGLDLPRGYVRSLTRYFDGAIPDEPLYSQHAYGYDINGFAVVSGQHKLIATPRLGQDATKLFDLEADPDERNDLSDSRGELVKSLASSYREHRRQSEAQRKEHRENRAAPDAETLERLRALGYLE